MHQGIPSAVALRTCPCTIGEEKPSGFGFVPFSPATRFTPQPPVLLPSHPFFSGFPLTNPKDVHVLLSNSQR